MNTPKPRLERRTGTIAVSDVLSHPAGVTQGWAAAFAAQGISGQGWDLRVGDNDRGRVEWVAERWVVPRPRTVLQRRASRRPGRRVVAPRWARA